MTRRKQMIRRLVQTGFLALTVIAVFVVGGNAERWCPFGGVEAIYTYATEGSMICSLGISNFYILAAVLVLTLLMRRVFCGYVCPLGTIAELAHAGKRAISRRTLTVPARLDVVLSLLKYGVLAAILFFTFTNGELVFRGFDPCYALLSRHGEDITMWAYVISAAIIIASLWISLPFCRWLCPAGALFNLFSRFGFTRVRREPAKCIACGQCSKACPMVIPVDRVVEVKHARCLSCLDCLHACPQAANALTWGAAGKIWPQAAVLAALFVLLAAAVVADVACPLPSFVKVQGDKPAQTACAEWGIENLGCRGRANLLLYYLQRDDDYALKGYLKLEAWPGPGHARTMITYDPAAIDRQAIEDAMTEPYFDAVAQIWRQSPFKLQRR